MTVFFKPLKPVAALLFMACSVAPAWAETPSVLMQGPEFAITSQDIQADSLRMPQEMRAMVLSRAQTVTQVASNLYARRAMALQAAKDGMEKDPAVAAALQIARDKVLSDAWMEKMDRLNEPKLDAAEAMAKTIYQAKPDRFKVEPQVRVRHILIAGNGDDAKVAAEQVLGDLKKGADFAKLAADRSADKGSAAKGGDLGFFSQGKMVPEFEAAAFALDKPGALSDIVKTQFGYHIIQLQEKKPEYIRGFDEVKPELVKEVMENVKHDARVVLAQKMQQGLEVKNEQIEALAAKYGAGAGKPQTLPASTPSTK
ncbi:peptidylprolyl isomerase [Acidovorax sp. DW039]|uniref:peptidylprolyl isomerase n=1 Tax=Acidovorax sp. DW039 TaxID=3095606 RepID=UPI00308A4489|nr:peptidylprolyl isomerase [Acidovorax sp. DW039]